MRKLMILSAAALFAGALVGSAHATPLSTPRALLTTDAIEQAIPGQGVTKARYHRGYRHYGWYRGNHYGWRHHYAWRGSRHCSWPGCV